MFNSEVSKWRDGAHCVPQIESIYHVDIDQFPVQNFLFTASCEKETSSHFLFTLEFPISFVYIHGVITRFLLFEKNQIF